MDRWDCASALTHSPCESSYEVGDLSAEAVGLLVVTSVESVSDVRLISAYTLCTLVIIVLTCDNHVVQFTLSNCSHVKGLQAMHRMPLAKRFYIQDWTRQLAE